MRLRLSSTIPVLLGLAACQSPSPVGGEATADATRSPPPALEVRYVEASGPPQDPTRPAPVVQPEDPADPRVLAEELRRELEREQQRRLQAEQQVAQWTARARELQARVLSLSLERARMEQEVLQLKIAALRAELAALEVPAEVPPAASRDGR